MMNDGSIITIKDTVHIDIRLSNKFNPTNRNPGPSLNIKTAFPGIGITIRRFYQYRNPQYEDKNVSHSL